MKKTGELLKAEREKRHISLNEISLTLKISTKILKAIEEGDPKNLPAKTFLRGFVQSYATALKLNSDEVLTIFYEEMGTTRPATNINAPEGVDLATSEGGVPVQRVEVQNTRALGEDVVAPMSEWSTKQKIAIFGGTLALLLGIFITRKIIEKYEREANIATTVSVPAPLTNAEAPVDTLTPPDAVEGDATVAAKEPTVAAAPAIATAPESAPMSAAPAPATAAPPLAAKPEPPAPTPVVKIEAPVEVKKPEPEKKNTEVILEALDAVAVEFTSGDGKKEKISLLADQVHTFRSKSGLSLNISDGGAVNLIVNGKDKGVPGNLGKPLKLSY